MDEQTSVVVAPCNVKHSGLQRLLSYRQGNEVCSYLECCTRGLLRGEVRTGFVICLGSKAGVSEEDTASVFRAKEAADVILL